MFILIVTDVIKRNGQKDAFLFQRKIQNLDILQQKFEIS